MKLKIKTQKAAEIAAKQIPLGETTLFDMWRNYYELEYVSVEELAALMVEDYHKS